MSSPESFWQEISRKRGAEIGFRSYAAYLGRARGSSLDKGGLLYVAGDTLWFEDLERRGGLLGFLAPPEPYVKTELAMPVADIRSVRVVRQNAALARIFGRANPPAPSVGRFPGRLLSRTAVEIGLVEDTHYFDVLDEKGLLSELDRTEH